MKRILVSAALCTFTAAIFSCQKEISDDNVPGQISEITKTVSVSGGLWNPYCDTRSAYEPGVGVKLSGDELLSVYYGDPAFREGDGSGKYMNPATSVVNNGDGTYSVTHPEIDGVETYDYYFFMPALSSSQLNGSGTSQATKLCPVQNPSAESFDPDYDFLVGKAQTGILKSETLEVREFRRMTAPFRLTLTDSGNILGGERISAVTLAFSGEPDLATAMTGLIYMALGPEYEDCKFNSINPAGKAVTAIYSDGLQASAGGYQVWYSVKPVEYEAGTELTVTVTSGTRTAVRTVSLTSPFSIKENMLNSLSFDISGEGATVGNSVYFDFTSADALSQSVIASDGETYVWDFSGCSLSEDDFLSGGLKMNGDKSRITLPFIQGKQIAAIRMYTNPKNQNNGNEIFLNGDVAKADFNYAGTSLTRNGGVASITVPESEYGKTLVLTSTAASVISGIAFDLVDAEAPSYDENDYYDMFTKGIDIVIGGEVYNATEYAARLYNVTELTSGIIQADASSAGILFVDPEGQTAPVEISAMTPGNSQGVVIVGRYRDSQPQIKFTSQYKLRGKKTVFKNLHLTAGHKMSFVNNELKDAVLVIEDCSVDLSASQILVQDVCADGSPGSITIDNSVIELNVAADNAPSIFAYSTKANKTVFSPTQFTMTNSVIFAKETVKAFVADFGNNAEKYKGQSVIMDISGNTFYNIWQAEGLVRGYEFAGFNLKDNVAAYGETANISASNLVCIYNSATASTVTGNYLYTSAPDGMKWNLFHSNSTVGGGEGNTVNGPSVPFASEDTSKGYFPVNSAVTSAGADYVTKYWMGIN